MQSTLRQLTLVDDLTGLYNRRGFLTLASHQLQLARRSERAFALIFGDLDGLKSINDTLGHLHGNRAIEEMAAIFKESFRASDIVSRLGGDEFCALMVNATTRTADLAHARPRERSTRGTRSRASGPVLHRRAVLRRWRGFPTSCWPKWITGCIRRRTQEAAVQSPAPSTRYAWS
jgi:diguanylate cyclase (GGDEF)-like protein